MLLAFLTCSIGLAHAEPDTTSSTNPGSVIDDLDAKDRAEDDDVEEEDVGEADETSGDGERDVGVRDRAEHASTDEDAVATDGLGDAHVDNPAPASIAASSHAPTWAHGVDSREAALRRRASWLGRVDVSITWRRALNESTAVRRDEVWIVGTWRL